MLFLSLTLVNNQEYLLGSTSNGEVYVWLFQELLLEYLNEQHNEDSIFNNICHFKLKEGQIFNLRLEETELDTLYFNDDYFLYAYSWSDILAEIKERRLLGFPAIGVSHFAEKFRLKFNINQEFGENIQKITSVDYNLKKKECFIGTNKGNILVLSLENFKVLHNITPVKTFFSLDDNSLTINAVKHYKDTFIIYANGSGSVQLWNYEGNNEIKTFKLDKDSLSPARCAEIDPEGRWLILGHDDYITRWHIETGSLTSAMPTITSVNCLVVESLTVYSGHDYKLLYGWNELGELKNKTETSVDSVTCLIGDVSGREKVMISAGNGPLVDVFINATRIISFLA